MRKILFSLAIIGTFATQAQEKAFQFGFELAPNVGWISPKNEDIYNDGVRIGFSWGFMGDIYLIENYAINTGLKFLYLNNKYKFPENRENFLGTTYRKLNTSYVQLPAVLRMRTQEIGNGVSVYGDFGLGLSLLLSATAEESFYKNNQLFATGKKKDVFSDMRYIRGSMIVGLGAYKDLAEPTKLNVGIRFDQGITNVLKGKNRVTNEKTKGTISFLEIKIGVLF